MTSTTAKFEIYKQSGKSRLGSLIFRSCQSTHSTTTTMNSNHTSIRATSPNGLENNTTIHPSVAEPKETLLVVNKQKQMITPCAMMFTKSGYIPHLTLSFSQMSALKNKPSVPYLLSLEHFLENNYDQRTNIDKKRLQTQQGEFYNKNQSFKQFLNHRETDILFCDPRDLSTLVSTSSCVVAAEQSPTENQKMHILDSKRDMEKNASLKSHGKPKPRKSHTSVAVRTVAKTKISTILPSDQRGSLTPEEYAQQLLKWKPDVAFSLADYGAVPLNSSLADSFSSNVSQVHSKDGNGSHYSMNYDQETEKRQVKKRKLVSKQVDRTLNFLSKTISCLEEQYAEMNSEETDGGSCKVNLFGVIGGETDIQERQRSASETVARFDDKLSGYVVPFVDNVSDIVAAGGMEQLLSITMSCLPKTKPRIVLGLQSLNDIVKAVQEGCDVIDNSWIYELTQRKQALVCSFNIDANGDSKSSLDEFKGHGKMNHQPVNKPLPLSADKDNVNIVISQQSYYILDLHDEELAKTRNSAWARDMKPILPDCPCWSCTKGYSRGYIHHLLVRNEMLAYILLMCHNMAQVDQFMLHIQKSIERGAFCNDAKVFLN